MKNHVHKLRRKTYKNGESIFFCVGADCKYKVNVDLSLGKRTECWRCGESFIINEYSIRLAKPHCMDCTKKKDEKLEIVGVIVKNEIISPKPSLREVVINAPSHSSVTDLKSRLAGLSHKDHSKEEREDTDYEIQDEDDIL